MSTPEITAQIDALRIFPNQLRALVHGLTPAQLTTAFLPNEWTVAQNVHHLADSHMHSYLRCKFIAATLNPTLQPYDQDRWAIFPDAQAADIETSLLLLAQLHQRWAHFFNTLSDTDLDRTGYHPENGPVSLRSILATYVRHGQAHLKQIAGVLAAQA
jgi:hypothetical protein